MRIFAPTCCLALALIPMTLITGCGTAAGPTLLVQKNVNGSYTLTQSGQPTDPPMFTANLASGDPVANTGADYYSNVTGTIASGVGEDMGDCNGQAMEIKGKITNPDHNNVYINMTGSTPGGGTLTLEGQMTDFTDLGSTFAGTIKVDGGSCSLAATNYVAKR